MRDDATEPRDAGVARWREFYSDRSHEAIERLAARYPAERSLTVDIIELYRYDPALSERLFEEPDRTLREARAALRNVRGAFDRVNIRITNHPSRIEPGDVRARHVRELVGVEGVVGRVDAVRPRVREAVYECEACAGTRRHHPQRLVPATPRSCPDCGTVGAVRLRHDRSSYVDSQRVRLVPESATVSASDAGDSAPERSIDVHLDDDLVAAADMHDRVRVTGVVRVARRDDGRATRNPFAFYVDAAGALTREPGSDDGGARDDDRERTEVRTLLESQWRSTVDE